MNSDKTAKIIDADSNNSAKISMDMDTASDSFAELDLQSAKTELTTEEAGNGTVYASAGDKQFVGLTIGTDGDYTAPITYAELENTNDALLTKIKDRESCFTQKAR